MSGALIFVVAQDKEHLANLKGLLKKDFQNVSVVNNYGSFSSVNSYFLKGMYRGNAIEVTGVKKWYSSLSVSPFTLRQKMRLKKLGYKIDRKLVCGGWS